MLPSSRCEAKRGVGGVSYGEMERYAAGLSPARRRGSGGSDSANQMGNRFPNGSPSGLSSQMAIDCRVGCAVEFWNELRYHSSSHLQSESQVESTIRLWVQCTIHCSGELQSEWSSQLSGQSFSQLWNRLPSESPIDSANQLFFATGRELRSGLQFGLLRGIAGAGPCAFVVRASRYSGRLSAERVVVGERRACAQREVACGRQADVCHDGGRLRERVGEKGTADWRR